MSFNLSYHYDQWGVNIPYTHIKHRQFMISAAWQWMHESKVNTVSVLDDPDRFKRDFRDDYHVIKTLKDLVDDADYVIAYNGARFDNKELNTGLAKHDLGPCHDYKTIDPCSIAKRKFRFKGGNSLANLCQFFGLEEQKGSVDLEDWIAATEGCPKAIKKIVSYNKQDIPTMVGVYEKIKAYAPGINMNHFVNRDGEEIGVCRLCGSSNLTLHKRRKLTDATVKHQYKCDDCGTYTTLSRSVRVSKYR